jgi:fibronectin type 3 domain-containing protein
MKNRIPILSLVCLVMAFPCLAQKNSRPVDAKLRIIGRPVKDKQLINLRWAVSNAQAWKLSNQYGFILERYTVIRDKQMLKQPEKKVIGNNPIKPRPLIEWQALAQKDNYAAVIAQALYGKDFQMSGMEAGGIAKIVAQSQELEQRFSFSLYAADMSFEAAKQAGWGYTDTDIRPNEKYFYRIRPAAPATVIRPDSTGVLIGMADAEELPKMTTPEAAFQDKTVMLSWSTSQLNTYYNTYIIEKSLDGGKNFHKLPGVPVANLNDREAKTADRLYFIDSLYNNTVTHQYRLRGINPFGEVGPPSEAVSGKGKSLLVYAPNINQSYVDDNGALQLSWEFDEKGEALINGFQLNQSEKAEGPYKVIMDNIPVAKRTLIYTRLQVSGYFTITAVAKEGEERSSFPVMVQPVDSTPPAVPASLTALIDSTGTVQLKWKANDEKDLLGYKIFRALKKDEELVPLVDSVWYASSFRDIVSLKLLNRKVYYAVAAIDHRFNQSAPSALVEVKKPAVIPPSPPVFTRFKGESGKVLLQWINSSDEDILTHTLYRKTAKSGWALIREFEGRSVAAYTDEDIKGDEWYTYRVEAKNEGGLISSSEQVVLQGLPGAKEKAILTRLYGYAHPQERHIELAWDDKLEQVAEYHIYKATGDKPMSLWKVVETGKKGLYDTEVQPNTTYQYSIMAVLKSGSFSEMKTVTVKY